MPGKVEKMYLWLTLPTMLKGSTNPVTHRSARARFTMNTLLVVFRRWGEENDCMYHHTLWIFVTLRCSPAHSSKGWRSVLPCWHVHFIEWRPKLDCHYFSPKALWHHTILNKSPCFAKASTSPILWHFQFVKIHIWSVIGIYWSVTIWRVVQNIRLPGRFPIEVENCN